MVFLVGLALAGGGSKQCRFRGMPATVTWTESGTVRVKDGAEVLVTADVGSLKGTTSATCLPEGVKFLTDTHERPGDLTLNTVKMGLSSVLDTLDPKRFKRRDAAPPRKKMRAVAKRVQGPKSAPSPVPRTVRPVLSEAGKQARSCVSGTVSDGYASGWRLRSLVSGDLEAGDRRTLRVVLYAHTPYRIDVCGDATVDDVDVWLANEGGVPVASERSRGMAGQVEYTVPHTGVYYLVVELPKRDSKAGAAVALSFK